MYSSLSLFSGIGGLCEGFKLAGFNVQGAAELDKYACASYRANFPDIPLYEGDIKEFLVSGSEEFQNQRATFLKDRLDVLFGGPPCQGFSQIGPRDPFDERNELYLQMCRIADITNPKVIVIENVPNLLLMKKGMFKDRIISALRDHGYGNVALLKLSASDFGVPQARHRVFFIAVRDDLIDISAQSIFESVAMDNIRPMVTTLEALSDLPEEIAEDSGVTLPYPSAEGNPDLSDFQREMRLDTDGRLYARDKKVTTHLHHASGINLHNHHTKDVQERRKKIISLLKPGQKANSLPKELWDNKRPEKWRRFDGNKPAHTLLAHMHRDMSEWIHPVYDRWITVREAMRLQSFHDGFVLETSEWQQLKQVGNAVPPLLGRIPALTTKAILELAETGESSVEMRGQMALI